MTRHSRPTAAACDPPSARTGKATGLRRHSLTLAISAALALSLGPGVAAQALPATFDLSSLDGSNGFVLDGESAFGGSGFSVSGAGDINGDGIDDLIIGASSADPNGIDNAGPQLLRHRRAGTRGVRHRQVRPGLLSARLGACRT